MLLKPVKRRDVSKLGAALRAHVKRRGGWRAGGSLGRGSFQGVSLEEFEGWRSS